MIIKRVPIKSGSSTEDPRPWYVIEFDEATNTVRIPEAKALGEIRAGSGKPEKVLPMAALLAQARAGNEEWVLAQYLDETIHFEPSSNLPPVMLAHLGIYRPWLDEFEILEFTE